MIAKEIQGSITKTPLMKLGLYLGDYECSDDEGIIRKDGPTMIYLLLKETNPATSIGVSNINDKTKN